MPRPTKRASQLKSSVAHARNVLQQSRTATPSTSAIAHNESAAPTPPLSPTATGIEQAVTRFSTVDEDDRLEQGPDLLQVDIDNGLESSETDSSDDGYGDDDLLSELEGEELRDSLKLQIEGEIDIIEQLEANKPTAYDTLMRGIHADQWQKAESKRSLGYNGLSERTRQQHRQEEREAEAANKVLRAS